MVLHFLIMLEILHTLLVLYITSRNSADQVLLLLSEARYLFVIVIATEGECSPKTKCLFRRKGIGIYSIVFERNDPILFKLSVCRSTSECVTNQFKFLTIYDLNSA